MHLDKSSRIKVLEVSHAQAIEGRKRVANLALQNLPRQSASDLPPMNTASWPSVRPR